MCQKINVPHLGTAHLKNIILFERHIYRKKKKESYLPSLVHCLNAVIARDELIQSQESGARSFFCVFHVGTGAHGFEASSAAFPDHRQEAGQKVEELGQEPAPYGMLTVWEEDQPATPLRPTLG